MNDFPINLYFKSSPVNVETLDLCRGESDFRKVYVADDGQKKIVIKHCSNTFTERKRIKGWFQLAKAYRELGLYCPDAVKTLSGETIYSYTEGQREYFVFAEEYAIYQTAEQIGEERLKDKNGKLIYLADLFRSLGKVANARFDVMDWYSGYSLLTPVSHN